MKNIEKLAKAAEYGVISALMAEAVGISRQQLARAARSGVLECVSPSVYVFAGAPDTWLRAACLLGGPGTAASHRCAAAVWELEGFGAGPVEVISPRWARLQQHGIRAHESKELDPSDLTRHRGIEVVSIERCSLLIGACADIRMTETATDDALRRGLTTDDRLRAALFRLGASGRNGIGTMRGVLALKAGPNRGILRSGFESRIAALLVAANLPEPLREHPVRLPDGRVRKLDLGYLEPRLVDIEADSERHHLARQRFQEDRTRQNELVLIGFIPLRFTWRDYVDRPDYIVRTVAEGLDM